MFDDHDKHLSLEEKIDGELENEERISFDKATGFDGMANFILNQMTPGETVGEIRTQYYRTYKNEDEKTGRNLKDEFYTHNLGKMKEFLKRAVFPEMQKEISGVLMTYERVGNKTPHLIDIKAKSPRGPVCEINGNYTFTGCKILYFTE